MKHPGLARYYGPLESRTTHPMSRQTALSVSFYSHLHSLASFTQKKR